MGAHGRRAIFFDRDGVLTEPTWNPATEEFESSHTVADLALCAGAIPALQQLRDAGYALFIVSNQPSYAKGKTSLEEIKAIAAETEAQFRAGGVIFTAAYYCYHHPHGIVPEFSFACACRKPSPYFLLQAAEAYGIDLAASWMLGDRDTDIRCGQGAGCHTVLVKHLESKKHHGASTPDYVAADVSDAARQILAHRDLVSTAAAN